MSLVFENQSICRVSTSQLRFYLLSLPVIVHERYSLNYRYGKGSSGIRSVRNIAFDRFCQQGVGCSFWRGEGKFHCSGLAEVSTRIHMATEQHEYVYDLLSLFVIDSF